MSTRNQVLIVGAGPVGLVAAITLLEQGVAAQVIDEQSADSKRTYPVLLHPRSLRVLGALGVTAPLEWRGRSVNRLSVYCDGQRRALLELPGAAEIASGAMTLPQDVLRRALMRRLEELGGSVDWQTRLTSLEQDAAGVRVGVVRRQRVAARGGDADWLDLDREPRSADYLIGADGVRSTVREKLGIAWTAMGRRQTYAFFDAADPRAGDEAQLVLAEDFGNSVYPLQGGSARFTFEIGVQMSHAPGPVQLRQLLASRLPWYSKAEQLEWSGSAEFSPALADSFGEGRAWLAGDAAHSTGPLGGQSLNVGIAEAHDLAHRIAESLERPGFPLGPSYCEQRRWQWQQLFGQGPSRPITTSAPDWVRRHMAALLTALPASGDDLDDLLEQLHVSAA